MIDRLFYLLFCMSSLVAANDSLTPLEHAPAYHARMFWVDGVRGESTAIGFETGHFEARFRAKDFAIEQLAWERDVELVAEAEIDGRVYRGVRSLAATNPTRSDCQLVEAGPLFNRRVMSAIWDTDFPGGAPAQLELVSWPDSLGFYWRIQAHEPTINAQPRLGLSFSNAYQVTRLQPWMIRMDGKEGCFLVRTDRESVVDPLENGAGFRVRPKHRSFHFKGDEEKGMGFEILPLPPAAKTPQLEAVQVSASQVSPLARDLSVSQSDLLGANVVMLEGPYQRDDRDPRRIKLSLRNPAAEAQVVRLCLERLGGGPITGNSAMLLDADGRPTGIPVQISKNWHSGGEHRYRGSWLRLFTGVRVPAGETLELELIMMSAFWGELPAASLNQLSLIGWGKNQLWLQGAVGSWGESICFEPDRTHGLSAITDVRPLWVQGTNGRGRRGSGQWTWTNNIGGGDFLRWEAKGAAERADVRAVRSDIVRVGPVVAEGLFQTETADGVFRSSVRCHLAQADDAFRCFYTIRLDVLKAAEIGRLAIFQMGADKYAQLNPGKMAIGHLGGVGREWITGEQVMSLPLSGASPWVSQHLAAPVREVGGAWANAGFVVRHWDAKVQGKAALPWLQERRIDKQIAVVSIADLCLDPKHTALAAGDHIECVIEHVVLPQQTSDYLGPNVGMREALKTQGNLWQLMLREVQGNHLTCRMTQGTLQATSPLTVRSSTGADRVGFELRGGLHRLPLLVHGLSRPGRLRLSVDGQARDIAVPQFELDRASGTWTAALMLPPGPGTRVIEIQLLP